MILISDDQRRRGFAVWLRTGRLPRIGNAGGVELKFNPWHDPANGRFTFAATGRDSGGSEGSGGGAGDRGAAARAGDPRTALSKAGRDGPAATSGATVRQVPSSPRSAPPRAAAPPPRSDTGWRGGGFTGGGGGRSGGAGASSTAPWPDPPRRPTASRSSAAAKATSPARRGVPPPPVAAVPQRPLDAQRHTEVRNGYRFEIDVAGRTVLVTGSVIIATKQRRSRTAQAQAGGADRRPTDDGGHYIAVRFDRPTEAFNHFAQDATINRGDYRVLEDQWAKAKRAGKSVTVKIVPTYRYSSKRPDTIDVWFTIDGIRQSTKFPKEHKEKRRGN